MSSEGSAPIGSVTLRTIADAAGVHVSTISRALRRVASGTGPVRESDERIAALAREMGYTPNPNAASLTTRKSTAFGVLVPRLTDVVLSSVYDAIEGAANQAGYDTFVANTHDEPAEQRRRIDLLLGRRVDGLILGDARLDGTNLVDLARHDVRFVLVSRRSPGFLSVSGDDYRGGWLVGTHLARLGHSRVGIITGPAWASTSFDRASGCADALAEAGVEVEPDYVLNLGFESEHGQQGAERLLDLRNPPTAIFAANDFAAIGAMGVLRARDLVPGRDLAIAGYNDIPIAAALSVPLTTVHSPMREMGVRAVETLLSAVHGLPVSSTLLPPTLVVRESTTG